MACNYPITAYRLADGSVVFDQKKGYDTIRDFKVPCGQCVGCRLERSRQWAVRCMHEASLYEENTFITLTYNDAHLPVQIDYRDFQLFMKRLRKRFGGYLPTKKHQGPIRKIRFFMCGEYGEDFGRPHFHACIFNLGFDDRVYFKTSPSGAKIFTSETLNSLWSDRNNNPIGYASLGYVNFESAGYVARYVMKKKYGKGSKEHYEMLDYETGEVIDRQPELTRMSLKPGIGYGFYQKYFSDIFPKDVAVINGKETKPPQYYFRKLKLENKVMYENIAYDREVKASKFAYDNTPERLEVKEAVLIARTKSLKRE